MNMEFLDRIYAAVSLPEKSHTVEGRRLDELWRYRREADNAETAFYAALNGLQLSLYENDLLCDAYINVICEKGEEAFINGFRLGMKLIQELGPMPPARSGKE